MLGANHIEFLLHCLRSKQTRDLKTKGTYAEDALRRLKLNLECQRALTLMLKNPNASVVDVALCLGWTPPLVASESLEFVAGRWLDQRG